MNIPEKMDSQWITGIIFGGVLISSLGAVSSYTLEEKKPTIKSILRDFIIGSMLFLFIMNLLPESSTSLLTYITSKIPSGGGGAGDMEIDVGVPTF